jgi:hypothetical protein
MKKIFLLASFATLFLMSSCNKTKYGNVTFWQETGSGYGITVVSVNGVTSNITSEKASTPECGDGTDTWAGEVTITEGCSTLKLY